MNSGGAVDVFLEIAEAVVHAILGSRGVYPKASFEIRQMFGAPVYTSRHPEVCVYVSTVIANLRPLFPIIDVLVLDIFDATNKRVESYCFKLTGRHEDRQSLAHSQIYDAEAQIRDLLLRTMALEWQRSCLPPGCTFRILVRTHGSNQNGDLDLAHELRTGSWLLASSADLEQRGGISPLQSVEYADLQFQLYVEHPAPL